MSRFGLMVDRAMKPETIPVLVALPKSKADRIIARFRFRDSASYWQCTHSRQGLAP